MLKISKGLSSLLGVALLVGCSSTVSQSDLTTTDKISAQSTGTTLSQRAMDGWKAHLASVASKGAIQKGCEPFIRMAQGEVKGSVMLFHGYSACPQQYEELATLLANKGYNVFVPLLPGHGKVWTEDKGKVTDDYSALPDVDSTYIYENYAKNISAIIKDEPGIKVVGGLSVGGVIAAKSMIDNPGVYTRGFLMAPFFNAAGPVNDLLPALGQIIPNKTISWGSDCESQRKLGRAGYCNFKLTNVASVRRFGADTLKDVANIKIPVQITGVEGDPAASNSAIADAKRRILNDSSCLFPKGASHSMLSPQDNVGKDTFWIEGLKRQIVEFVDTGKYFNVVGKSEYDLGLCGYK